MLFADHDSRPDPEKIPAPKGMTAAAKKIWAEKVDTYRQRGQKIQGYEAALRQYCELEAALDKVWKHSTPPMAMINTYRMLAAEFYDTPASRKVSGGGKGAKGNKFANNGRSHAAAG